MEHEIKRTVQKILFRNIQSGLAMRGLAGWESEVYRDLVQRIIKPSELTLVDIDPVRATQIGVKCEYLQDGLSPIMDCDFCETYKKSGETLKLIKVALDNENYNDRYLLFTLCLRGAPLHSTLEWLNENIYKGTLKNIINDTIYTYGSYGGHYLIELLHEQSIFKKSIMYHYKDTHPMITGMIQW